MPKACARSAVSVPILPRPMMPSVLPANSVPCRLFLSHLPARVVWSAREMWRAMAIIRPSVSSATETALAPGAFITTMPRRVATSTSMLSTPTPARPITRMLLAASISAASACTAERTISASASETASRGIERKLFRA